MFESLFADLFAAFFANLVAMILGFLGELGLVFGG